MEPKFKKVSDTRAEGTGESVLKGGCCAMMFHDKGDIMEYKDGKWYMTAGNSPAYPPCMQGKTLGYIVPKGGAPPQATEMER